MAHVVRFNGKKLDPATIKALVSGTLVAGSKPSVWWNRQSIDFRNSFMDTMRTSMRNGESLTQAITRVVGGTVDGVSVPGIMQTTKAKAGALAATAQSAVTNEAALKTFQANNDVIKAVSQISTLDNRTSDICVAYSGQTWDVNTLQPVMGGSLPFNGGPPRHFNCRSRLRPVTMSFKELGIDADEIPAGTRASMDGQVPADITFHQFLKKKSKGFQDDLLGPKRAQLWRNDQITLTQLVDMRGNPLSIAQLEKQIGIKPKPTFDPATNRIKDAPKIVKQDPDAGLKAALQKADDDLAAAKVDAAQEKRNALFNDSVANFLKQGNDQKILIDWIEKQGAHAVNPIPKSVVDSAKKLVDDTFKKASDRAKKLIDDLDKKHPDGLIAFENAADTAIVAIEEVDPLLAAAMRARAFKVIDSPVRQDFALIVKMEKRIEQGIPEVAARKIILNSKASDAAKKKASDVLNDAIKAARQEAEIAIKQIANIDFDSIDEFAAWVKGIRPGLSGKFADREFMALVEAFENRVLSRLALKESAKQVVIGDLGQAEAFLKNLPAEQVTKEVTEELAKLAKRRAEMKVTAQKVMDDLTNKGTVTPDQIEDVVQAASEMAKPTMKIMIQDIGFQMKEAAQSKIDKIISEFPFKVIDDLKKKGFSNKQIALIDDEFIEQIGILKIGVFDEAVAANMVKTIEDATLAINNAIKKIKALNKASKGTTEMSAVINALPDKLRVSTLLQDGIKKTMKQAAKKASDARKLVSDELLIKAHVSPTDFSLYSELIKDSLKDVHKKLGPKQLQAKVNEIKSKVASAKKGEVSIAEFAKDPTDYDSQVLQILSNDAVKKLDDIVKLFINDGAGSPGAKSGLFDILYSKSASQTRAIKEYVHRRVNPKKLANGMDFDAKVAEIVTKHANNVDAKVIRAHIDAFTTGENASVKLHFNQTIMTRAGVKNVDELGVLAEGDAPLRVLDIRKRLKKDGDPSDIPIPKGTLKEDFTAAKEWLNAKNLADDEFKRQQLQQSKSLVASGKRNIAAGDKTFGANSWGISPAQWDDWVKNVAPTLTEWDVALINQYTGGMAGQINAGLYSGGTNPVTMGGARALNKALDKMPKHTGTVYRGTSSRSDWTADYIDARYEVGKTVTERGFGSSSTQESSAFNGPLKFIIKSKGRNGAIIGQVGQYGASEMEVLWKAGSKFRVLKKVRSGDGIKVWMEEV